MTTTTMIEQLQTDKEIVFAVAWAYEDALPDYITDKLYDLLYPMSQIRNGVRMFPYIAIDERKLFLGDFPPDEGSVDNFLAI